MTKIDFYDTSFLKVQWNNINKAHAILRILTNMQLISHFKHHVYINHHLPKLGQISFVKTQKGFRPTKEEKRDREKKPKHEIQNF